MNYHELSKEELIELLVSIQSNNENRDRISFELNERIKELTCHNELTILLTNNDLSFDEMIEGIIEIIPPAFQFPKYTKVAITIFEKVYQSKDFKYTSYLLKTDIVLDNNIIGKIEVCYDEDTQYPKQVFLNEEEKLLITIAARIGGLTDRNIKKNSEVQTEQRLLETELKYQNMVERINDVIFEVGIDGVVKYVSPAIKKMLGFNPRDLIGKNFFNYMYPEDIQLLKIAFDQINEVDYSYLEYRYFRKDGSLCWVRSSTVPVFSNGELSGGIGVLTNINERKIAEIERDKTENLYSSILKASPDCISITNLEGKILFVSPSAFKMFGYEQNFDFSDFSILDFIDKESHQKAINGLEAMFKNEFYGAEEYFGIKADGSKFDVEVNGEFIRNSEGRPINMVFVTRDISQRKKAEENLRMSELRYKSFFENNSSIIILVDPQTGDIMDVNPAAINYYGWSKEKICKMNISEINILNQDEIEIEMQKAKKEERKHFNFKHRLANDEIHDVEVYSGPIEFAGKTLLYSIVHDITERVEAETALRESEEKYRRIFETVQDAFYEATLDGKILEISPAIEKISKGQYKRSELIGQSLIQFYAKPEARDVFFTQLQKTGHVYDYEIEIVNKDQSIVFVAISSSLVYDSEQKPLKITGSIRDITERKHAEQELKSSEEKYRLLFANNPQPMWIYDLETLKILEVNHSSIEQYGYSRDEFLNMSIKDIRPAEDLNELMNDIAIVRKYNQNTKSIWRHIWKNGELRYVEINAQSLDYKGRKARHVLINDVTERIKTEIEINNKTNVLTNLIVNLKEGILLESSDRKIILTNQLFCEMFNIDATPESLTGADCTDSAEKSKYIFKHPEMFVQNIEEILKTKTAVFNDEIELNDGRVFERDFIPTYIEGIYSGHLWKYRDITERKQAILKIAESEERFSQVVAQSQEVVWEVNVDGMYSYVSPMSTMVYGYPPEAMIAKMYFYDLFPQSKREELKKEAFDVFRRKDTFTNQVLNAEKPNGERLILLKNGIPLLDENGELKGYRGIDADITESKLAEEKLLKANRLISVISTINQTIVKEKNKESLLSKVCDIIVNSGKFQMAWIGMVDEKTKLVVPLYKSGFEEGYLSVIKPISIDENTPEGRGPTGNAMREGRYFVTNDIENDPNMRVWKNEALQRNYHSAIAIPIKQSGKTIGVISIYSRQTNFFNVEELELLNDIMDNISFALESFEKENERRKSENELRKLSLAVEQSPVSVVITNTNGDIEYANPMACHTTGYSLQELIGKNPRVLQSGETDRYEYEELWKTITSGTSWHGVFHNKKKTGELYWESSTITAITNENGELTHYVAIKEDITERRKSEEDIRKFRTIADIANYGTAINSLDGKFLYVNENWASMHGYTVDELLGENLTIGHNDEQKKQVAGLINELSETGEMKPTEVWHVRKDGSVFPTLMSASVIFDEKKNTQYFSATAIDISDRIAAEMEIQKLSFAVTQSPDLIVITDINGNIEFVNPAFEKVTGFTFEMVKGKNTRILKSGKNDSKIYVDLWNTIKSGKIWTNEWINIKRNGEYYWEYVSISPIHDSNGKIVNFLAIKQDITERKRNEQEIIDLNINLERKIIERTSELAETNQNLLNEINERKRVEESLSLSEYKYRTVVENISEVIFQTDTEGKWIFLNQSWENITGFTIEESLGRKFIEFIHPDDKAVSLDLFTQLINGEKDYSRKEIRYLTKKGEFRWIEVYTKSGVNEKNEVTGTYGSLQDITERKHAHEFENEMLQLSPQLTGITLSEISSALNLSLARIGKFLNADRAYIFEFNASVTEMTNTYEWCNEGIPSEMQNLQKVPVSLFPKWMETILKRENIIIPSVSDLPESWKAEKEIIENQQIQSLIVIPMFSENQLIGFVGLDDLKRKRNYTESEVNSLRIWGSMLVSLINNYHTEKLIEESRQNFEIFFNTIDDFLWVLDENANIIHINNTVIDRLGYTTQELEKQSVLKVHSENRRDEAAQIVNEMLQGKAEFCPVPIITKSGNLIPVETRVKHGYWNSKPAIFGVSKDISKIQLSERKFATAFESNSAIMAISDYYSGEYVDVNNTFVNILGYSKDELIGSTNHQLQLFVDSNLRFEIIKKLDAGLQVRDLEVEIRSKKAEIINLLLSADIIYIADKKCLLTVSIDISDRKIAEEEMQKARLEAERANIAKSEFLSRMSHELRTPMNSILGFAQILEMGDLAPGQKKSVNHILKSGKHLLGLINEVLDISRIEAGRLSISIEPIKLSGILDEMVDVNRPLTIQNSVKIITDYSVHEQLYVRSDRQSLKQVLLNLLNNAVNTISPTVL